MKVKLSKTEGKSLVWKEIDKQWNQYWKNQEKGRHLYKLQSVAGETGIRECNLKNIVESTKSKEGRTIIIGFLVSTGIIKRI